jgi:hypothetical protein
MGVVEAVIAAVLEAVAAALELFELVLAAVSRLPNSGTIARREA